MSVLSDRQWPLPRRPWVMRMTWSDLLFAHWPIQPDIIARLLPDGMQLDTYDGLAWVGVVPFTMSGVSPRCCPSVPGLSRFLELNLRTYVKVNQKPGVWFFSLDAASRFAVRLARATFNLPYMDASMSLERPTDELVRYCSRRTHDGEPAAEFAASYHRDGDFRTAVPNSLEFWLTARYCLYSVDRMGRIYRGEIDHPPWLVAKAAYTEEVNTLGSGFGIDFTGPPHTIVVQPIGVRAWLLSRCGNE
ncbi:MAG: DUF2071 domain-containing protein [Planctomycetota bacterium]